MMMTMVMIAMMVAGRLWQGFVAADYHGFCFVFLFPEWCCAVFCWHKFQLLAFSNNLKQIKFAVRLDYCLLIGEAWWGRQ